MGKLKKLSVILIVVLLVMQVTITEAKDAGQLQKDLMDAKNDLSSLKDKIDANDNKQKATAYQLKKLNSQITETERKINVLEEKIAELDTSIKNSEQELGKALENLKEREELLGGRVQAIYKYSSLSYVSILFKSESLADFLSRYTMMRKLITVDRELIKEISEQRVQLEEEKKSLEEAKKAMEVQRETVECRRTEYQTRSAQRNALMQSLKEDKKEFEKALNDLEETSKKLEKELQAMGEPSSVGTGKFTWPTPGTTWVTSPFGYRNHPVTGKRSFHRGIDIGIGYGKNIYASDGGTVVHSGSYGNYGLAVVINHGNGKSSLYAHNSKLLVKKGQVVTKGQLISKCGTTGLSTGPHLHFEIRNNGTPSNPMNYVKKR